MLLLERQNEKFHDFSVFCAEAGTGQHAVFFSMNIKLPLLTLESLFHASGPFNVSLQFLEEEKNIQRLFS